MRVKNGLVAMEKSEYNNSGRKKVVRHKQTAIGDSATASNGSSSSLSVTRKEYIVRYYDQNVNPDVFVTKMISNKMSPCICSSESGGCTQPQAHCSDQK